MKCPLCNVDLVMSERQGIEIDYCPQCRGVWLDRGELDKIIERSAANAAPMPQQAPRGYERGYEQRSEYAPQPRYEHDRWDDDKRYKDGYKDNRKKKKRGGFLEDLFEFGD